MGLGQSMTVWLMWLFLWRILETSQQSPTPRMQSHTQNPNATLRQDTLSNILSLIPRASHVLDSPQPYAPKRLLTACPPASSAAKMAATTGFGSLVDALMLRRYLGVSEN